MYKSTVQCYFEQATRLSYKMTRTEEFKASDDELINANLIFAYNRALDYHRDYKGVPLVEMIAEANVGLMKATRKFDRTRGTVFITYAAWHVDKMMQTLVCHRFARAKRHGLKFRSMQDVIYDAGDKFFGKTLEDVIAADPSNHDYETPAAVVSRQDDIAALKSHIADLDAKEKKYLRLRFNDGLSRKQISRRMNYEAHNLGTLERRIIKNLRQRMLES